jgi:iron complex outermembrane receptor protein
MINKPKTNVVRLTAFAGAACIALMAGQAWAQAAAYKFDIPAESLSKALRDYGRATRQQLVFTESMTDLKSAPSVKGDMSAEAALERILAGSGLVSERTPAGAIIIRPADKPQASAVSNDRQMADLTEVVVTGSRIRTTNLTTPAPVAIVNAQQLQDQGFVQVGQALNQITSIVPSVSNSGNNSPVMNQGQTFPNLFGLGGNRTLTLMNGRRMPTTSAGLDGEQTDTNIIPIGLLDRIDIVQGGGASVYGSGAIAGVVNYVLKDHFQGITFDTQYSNTGHSDYPTYSARVTMGTDFLDGRGNVALNVDYSHSDPLLQSQRSFSAAFPIPVPNPAFVPGGKSTVLLLNGRDATDTAGGLVLASNTALDTTAVLTGANGLGFRFNPDGSLAPYNLGVSYPTFPYITQGGDGYPLGSENTLLPGIERITMNEVGHFDLTDHVKLTSELLYARTTANDPLNRLTRGEIGPLGNTGAVAFNRNNPFLTPATVAQLSAVSPTFASGGNLYLGDMPTDLLPSNAVITKTNVYRGQVGAQGDFDAANRHFYWDTSYSYAKVEQKVQGYNIITANLKNALAQPVVNAQGQIVCNPAITTDPACVPINLFGLGHVTDAGRAYISALSGQNNVNTLGPFTNTAKDFLATLGGDVVNVPAGTVKFSLTYEHRDQSASFNPLSADQAGIIGRGTKVVPASGSYNTNEYAGELAIPVLGNDFNIPYSKALDLNGSYRIVDHSLAGRESVWGLGAHWAFEGGITLRASFSRNFNAPTLTQLIAPQSASFGPVNDPCSSNQILNSASPAVRGANCLALFTANPTYGASAGNPNATAAQRLAGFNDPSANIAFPSITTGGNPDLNNETSKTRTFGILLQPTFAPGLTVSADRVVIHLKDSITNFTPATFLQNCFDSTTYPNALCSTVVRAANGNIVSGVSTAFNAFKNVYRGEIYNIDYQFELNRLTQGADIGSLDLNLQATHNEKAFQVQPLVTVQKAGTIGLPRWTTVLFAHYTYGPLRVNYTVNYRPSAPQTATDTFVNAPVYPVKSNTIQSVSAQYRFGKNLSARAGVNNFMNTPPSFPTIDYGSAVGREFFVGLTAKY